MSVFVGRCDRLLALAVLVSLAACSSSPAAKREPASPSVAPEQSGPASPHEQQADETPVASSVPKLGDPGTGWVQVFSGSYSKAHGGVADAWSEPIPTDHSSVSSGEDAGTSDGDHVLEFLDASGRVLVSVAFDVEDRASGTGETFSHWRVEVPDPPEFTAYRIVREGPDGRSTVFEFARSATAPTVTLRSPQAGELVEGSAVELSWFASDADSDELSASLYYSINAGATYRSVCCSGRFGTDRYGEAFMWSLDRALLESYAPARVMVVVSDGARWAAAESPVFSFLPPREPESVPRAVSMRFEAYANPDDDDGIDGGPVAGVELALFEVGDRKQWWEAVAPLLDDRPAVWQGIPPGVAIQSSTAALSSAPAQFVTTAEDGVAGTTVEESNNYMACALSPVVEALIAGCSDTYFRAGKVYVYFSHGRAYLHTAGRPSSKVYNRHERASDGAAPSSGDAELIVVSTQVCGSDVVSDTDADTAEICLTRNTPFAVIGDADVGAWWDAVSDGGRLSLDHYGRDAFVGSTSELIASAPARFYTTGATAVAEVSVDPGDYLLCAIQEGTAAKGFIGNLVWDCTYEDILPTHTNVVLIWFDDQGASEIVALSIAEGTKVLRQAQQANAG